MVFEWDTNKAESNYKKHGILFDEAKTALLDPNALAQEDPDSENENRWILIGMTQQAKLLTVVYTLRQNSIRLISARKATKKKKEINYYAR